MSSVQLFSKKKVLIIEDHAEMRSSLKSMLMRFGITEMETANCGDEGITAILRHSYDIVICDYDLGKGKDGHQVLEEGRNSGKLKANTAFVMVTAQQTAEMVLGALEYEPDCYITKPITFDILNTRLTRIMQIKSDFSKINIAIDKKQLEQAVQGCDLLMKGSPKYTLMVLRIKGSLLLELERYDEAEEAFDTAINIKKLPWATLGKGKALFYKGELDAAEAILNELGKLNERFVETYDWLAKIHEKQNNAEKVQMALQEAVRRSPKGILRQMELGKCAKQNEDWEVASKAFRKSVNLGKNSCHKTPENYFNLAEALQPALITGSIRDKKYASHEALTTLNNVRKEYRNEPKVVVESRLLEGETFHHIGRQSEANTAFSRAQQAFEELGDRKSLEIGVKIAKKMIAYGDSEKGKIFSQKLKETLKTNEEESELLDNIEEEVAKEVGKIFVDMHNNKGVALYEQGEIEGALNHFLKAVQNKDASHSIFLNTIQATIALLEQGKGDSAQLKKVTDEMFTRLEDIRKSDERYPRYLKLQEMYENLEVPS